MGDEGIKITDDFIETYLYHYERFKIDFKRRLLIFKDKILEYFDNYTFKQVLEELNEVICFYFEQIRTEELDKYE
jgi:hypothetical protein